MEIFKKRYGNSSDSYNEIIEKLTSAWSWDKIEDITNRNIGQRFYVGNSHLDIYNCTGQENLKVVVYFNKQTDSPIAGPFTVPLLWFTYVKTPNTLLIQFFACSNYNDEPGYASAPIFMIGSGTNMITKSKENVMSILSDVRINDYSATSNLLFIPSDDIIEYKTEKFGAIRYNSNVALTMISPVSQMRSQVIMDNIYIVNRCNLTQPSMGECTLGDKKYFMFYHIWVPYE